MSSQGICSSDQILNAGIEKGGQHVVAVGIEHQRETFSHGIVETTRLQRSTVRPAQCVRLGQRQRSFFVALGFCALSRRMVIERRRMGA